MIQTQLNKTIQYYSQNQKKYKRASWHRIYTSYLSEMFSNIMTMSHHVWQTLTRMATLKTRAKLEKHTVYFFPFSPSWLERWTTQEGMRSAWTREIASTRSRTRWQLFCGCTRLSRLRYRYVALQTNGQYNIHIWCWTWKIIDKISFGCSTSD